MSTSRGDDEFPAAPHSAATVPPAPGADRERIRRTLTFWLRPAFVLRALNRFQRVAGFDRAMGLASSALTALVPLVLIGGAILPHIEPRDVAQRIIHRYGLTGGGAEAVKDVLGAGGTGTDINVIGALLLMIAVLSFTRGVQRLFEQTWEIKPLSIRNTFNDLVWIAGLAVYFLASGWIHRFLDHSRVQITTNVVLMPVSAIFLGWSGWILSARRIKWRDLVPFAVLGAVLLTVYFIGAAVYVPHLFSSYATRYGLIGAVFAMISTLFGVMLVVTASAAVGREVQEEFDRIGRGDRPADDEVRREWDAVIDHARSRWQTVRERVDRRRRRESSCRPTPDQGSPSRQTPPPE